MPIEPSYPATPQRPLRAAPPDVSTASQVPLTVALITINAVVFALEELWGGSDNAETLLRMGALGAHLPGGFRWSSLIAYGYLHIGLIHLAVNMYALWNLGRSLEPILGSARLFVLYTASMLGGGLAVRFGSHADVVAGASGALFGLLGSVSVLLAFRYRRTRNLYERAFIRRQLLSILVPNLVISLLPGISFLGHAGGLLVGIVFVAGSVRAYADDPTDDARARRARGMSVAGVACLILTIVAIASAWLGSRPWSTVQGRDSRGALSAPITKVASPRMVAASGAACARS